MLLSRARDSKSLFVLTFLQQSTIEVSGGAPIDPIFDDTSSRDFNSKSLHLTSSSELVLVVVVAALKYCWWTWRPSSSPPPSLELRNALALYSRLNVSSESGGRATLPSSTR